MHDLLEEWFIRKTKIGPRRRYFCGGQAVRVMLTDKE
jgi:hypothetical protein